MPYYGYMHLNNDSKSKKMEWEKNTERVML